MRATMRCAKRSAGIAERIDLDVGEVEASLGDRLFEDLDGHTELVVHGRGVELARRDLRDAIPVADGGDRPCRQQVLLLRIHGERVGQLDEALVDGDLEAIGTVAPEPVAKRRDRVEVRA